MLGGNASSEIRMWVRGAKGIFDRETGLISELEERNIYYNPTLCASVLDATLYGMVEENENIDILMNTTCLDAECTSDRILSVTGWQLATYTFHKANARIFLDCSGDCILSDLVGAEYRHGRESKDEYSEQLAQERADSKTMGMSVILAARETDHPVKFTPLPFANVYPDDSCFEGDAVQSIHAQIRDHKIGTIGANLWWVELGGECNSIFDADKTRAELYACIFGGWDHMKNRGDHGMENWELEWVGFLPRKRESRRYVGDYVLTQQDVENCPRFYDTVAYGGWQIDNHLPGGFHMDAKGEGHLQKRRVSEPYSIPLRSLYSKNIDNLMFAGRNISASHVTFSSTRVMGTIGVIGQAAGTAAAIAAANRLTPREAAKSKIADIQKALMDDDCFLLGFKREASELAKKAELTAEYGDPSALLNGIDRRIWENDNGYFGKTNKAIIYTFDEPTELTGVRLVLDSDLDREYTDGNPDALHTSSTLFFPKTYNNTTFGFPRCLIKHYRIDVLNEKNEWNAAIEVFDNHQRFIKHTLNMTVNAVRFIPLSTYHSERKTNDYGSSTAHIFNFEIL